MYKKILLVLLFTAFFLVSCSPPSFVTVKARIESISSTSNPDVVEIRYSVLSFEDSTKNPEKRSSITKEPSDQKTTSFLTEEVYDLRVNDIINMICRTNDSYFLIQESCHLVE